VPTLHDGTPVTLNLDAPASKAKGVAAGVTVQATWLKNYTSVGAVQAQLSIPIARMSEKHSVDAILDTRLTSQEYKKQSVDAILIRYKPDKPGIHFNP
jgi:hypothetical protein